MARHRTGAQHKKRRATRHRARRSHPRVARHGKTSAARRHYINYRRKVDEVKKEFYP